MNDLIGDQVKVDEMPFYGLAAKQSWWKRMYNFTNWVFW